MGLGYRLFMHIRMLSIPTPYMTACPAVGIPGHQQQGSSSPLLPQHRSGRKNVHNTAPRHTNDRITNSSPRGESRVVIYRIPGNSGAERFYSFARTFFLDTQLLTHILNIRTRPKHLSKKRPRNRAHVLRVSHLAERPGPESVPKIGQNVQQMSPHRDGIMALASLTPF